MNQAIVKIYWRSLRRGARAFTDIPPELREDVRALASAAVEAGEITTEERDRLLG